MSVIGAGSNKQAVNYCRLLTYHRKVEANELSPLVSLNPLISEGKKVSAISRGNMWCHMCGSGVPVQERLTSVLTPGLHIIIITLISVLTCNKHHPFSLSLLNSTGCL